MKLKNGKSFNRLKEINRKRKKTRAIKTKIEIHARNRVNFYEENKRTMVMRKGNLANFRGDELSFGTQTTRHFASSEKHA